MIHTYRPVGSRPLYPEEARLIATLTGAGALVRLCTCGHILAGHDERRLQRVMDVHLRMTAGGRRRHPSAGGTP